MSAALKTAFAAEHRFPRCAEPVDADLKMDEVQRINDTRTSFHNEDWNAAVKDAAFIKVVK